MKTILYLLFVIPGFCFSQTENKETPKPATDDCPSWNKKSKSSSKAEYFQYLRSGRSIKNQQQTAVYYPNAQRLAPGTQVQAQRVTEPNPFFMPRKERRNPQTLPKRENAPTILKEEKTEDPKPVEIIKPKEEPVIAVADANEGKNAEPALKEKEVSADPTTTVKDKPKTESTFKRRLSNLFRKKGKVCKSGSASKCPSF